MSPQDFIDSFKTYALASSALSGLPPGVTIAQAALESNWGESGLSRKYNNYFGLKAHGKFLSTVMPTVEDDAAGEHKVKAGFAIYASIDECVADRDRIISHLPIYANAYQFARLGDVENYVLELAKHWATDLNYAQKIMQVYRTHALDTIGA